MVPIPTFPKKYDVAVVVAIKLPTVNCVPVAMMTPLAFVVTMELIGRGVSDVNGSVPVKLESERQLDEIA